MKLLNVTVFMYLIFSLFSCQKEPVDVKKMQGSGSVFDRDDGIQDDPVCCDCIVEIIDYRPEDSNDRLFLLQTKAPNGDCYPDCPYFGGMYYDPVCTSYQSPCFHDLSYPDPTGLYNFNCCVRDTSKLTISFGGFYLNSSCFPGGSHNDTLVYRLICTNENPGQTCNGVSYQSDPITVVANNTDRNKAKISFSKYLECDCFPEVN